MSTRGINLDKLVPQILLDIDLLHYFASHGRRVAALGLRAREALRRSAG